VIFCQIADRSIYVPMPKTDCFKAMLKLKPSRDRNFFSWMSQSWRSCLGE